MKFTTLQIILILTMCAIAIGLLIFGVSIIRRTLPEMQATPVPSLSYLTPAAPDQTSSLIIQPAGTSNPPPDIIFFEITPDPIPSGSCTEINWQIVDSSTIQVLIYADQNLILDQPIASGSIEYCPEISGTLDIQLKAKDVDGNTSIANQKLVVIPPTQTPASPLVKEWELVFYINNDGNYITPITNTLITASFRDDQSLSGTSGCNMYNTRYTVQEKLDSIDNYDRLLIVPVENFEKACDVPESIMDQERTFLNLIQNAFYFNILDNRLEIFGADERILLIFKHIP